MSKTTTGNTETSPSSTLPPCRLVIRSKKQVELVTLPRANNPNTEESPTRRTLCTSPTSLLQVSPDGTTAYVHVAGKGICKLNLNDDHVDTNNNNNNNEGKTPTDAATNITPFLPNSAAVQLLALSPSGTYIITWERWQPTDANNKNLKLWRASDATLLATFAQKSLSREAWPYLHFTRDEQLAFLHAGTGEIRVYPARAFVVADDNNNDNTAAPRYLESIKIPGMTSMSVPQHALPAPTTNNNMPLITSYIFAAFCPKTKDKPARACLYQYLPGMASTQNNNNNNNNNNNTIITSCNCLAQKSLFQAEEMQVRWNDTGDAALITLQTSLDATGQSYYGNSQLFLMKAKIQQQDSNVIAVPDCDEPIVDVAWIPSGNYYSSGNSSSGNSSTFLVVSGRMPAMTKQHHGQSGQAVYQFGHAHRNTIAMAPHGRFFCLAGFGNLAGGMSFWDKNKRKLIPGCPANLNGTLRAEAATMHSWSPDSRLFMVATCSPRMNVDNGIRVFKYNGVEITDQMPWKHDTYQPDQLLQAMFVPALPGTYPDRPQSPIKERTGEDENNNNNTTSTTTTTVASSSGTAASTSKTAATRNTTATTTTTSASAGRYVPPSARNRPSNGTSLAERMRREKEGKLLSAGEVVSKPAVVGLSSTAGKKVIPGLVVGASAPQQQKTKSALKREKAKQKQLEMEAAKKLQEAMGMAMQEQQQAEAAAAPVDPEKRARKIKKVLKQIEELKSKAATTTTEELNEEQKAKLASEASLREELAQLGI